MARRPAGDGRVGAVDPADALIAVGDDFGDFLPNVKKNITPAQRAALVDQYQTHWGTKFFMLTNPTYGSWDTILSQPKQQYLFLRVKWNYFLIK